MEDIKIRIKNLLNKAESTEFEAEAEAFYAKAASLMAKHSLSQEEIEAVERQSTSDVEYRRVVVVNPYSMDRMLILVMVARAFGGDAYFMKQSRDGYKTRNNIKDHNTYAYVVGLPADIDRIIQMYESVSPQCDRFREMHDISHLSLGRKKVWNKSFIRGYASRIGKRLKDAYQEVIDEQEGSVALVLRHKADIVEEAIRRKTSGGKTTSSRQTDGSGYVAGAVAADQAHIHKGQIDA